MRRSSPGRIRLGRGGEFDVIRSILAEAGGPGPRVFIGPGDDALVLQGGWVLSCDLSMEDIHFRRGWLSLREMGYRAAAAALSDLAAMAADVEGIVTSIAAPPADGPEGVKEVAAGVREAVESVGGALLGGDLSASSGPLVVDVVALGRTEQPVSRVGAGPGDALWVTGGLGAAAGAVQAWERGEEPPSSLKEAFARPTPRVAEARWLVERVRIHALIDVSDGVAGDAGHLAAAGGVRILLHGASIPVHPGLWESQGSEGVEAGQSAENGPDFGGGESVELDTPLDLALRGGEDYELLFAAEVGSMEPLVDEFEDRFGVALTPIGRVEEGDGVFLELPREREGEDARGGEGETVVPLEAGGHSHFPEEGGREEPGSGSPGEAPTSNGPVSGGSSK